MNSWLSPDTLEQLRGWQTGIGALLGSFFGLVAIVVGALFNFFLNRRRDDRLRAEERLSVAVALYGEILLIRNEAARLARVITNVDHYGTIEIDQYFLDAHPVPEPVLYKALAPKIGLLSPALILAVTEFYSHVQDMKQSLPLLVEKEGRSYSYGPAAVLRPAVNAVHNIASSLREIERMALIQNAADEPDLGRAEDLIELEDLKIASVESG